MSVEVLEDELVDLDAEFAEHPDEAWEKLKGCYRGVYTELRSYRISFDNCLQSAKRKNEEIKGYKKEVAKLSAIVEAQTDENKQLRGEQVVRFKDLGCLR